MTLFAGAMAVALLAEAALGWPAWLFDRIGHPVTWIGALIAALDRRWNRPDLAFGRRRARGVAAMALTVAAAVMPAAAVQMLLPEGLWGMLLTGLIAAPLVATRSLHDHVADVARPLAALDLAGARLSVARIVGRDPARLDAAGVARAALESLAENASDGVVAPVFWGAIFGLPGIAGYKAINTLDSMIGHRTARHAAFGWASARIDDLANLIPARATGLLFVLTSRRPRAAWRVMVRDAGRHRSPNAGWPEAALAGGLGIRLSGPRAYAGGMAEEPWVNEGAPDPDAAALSAGLRHYRRAMVVLAVLLTLAALV